MVAPGACEMDLAAVDGDACFADLYTEGDVCLCMYFSAVYYKCRSNFPSDIRILFYIVCICQDQLLQSAVYNCMRNHFPVCGIYIECR